MSVNDVLEQIAAAFDAAYDAMCELNERNGAALAALEDDLRRDG